MYIFKNIRERPGYNSNNLTDIGILIDRLSKGASITPFIANLLYNRGITEADKAKGFLNPQTSSLHDPYLLRDMEKAVARISSAIKKDELICIFGDYDADGITATAILYKFLTSLGVRVMTYIPNRHTEGYGLNKDAIEKIANRGCRLIITVDCGITGNLETLYAARLGLDLIITDHHTCPRELPPAIAVINPHRPDDYYPFKDLAGVGVCCKLIQALDGGRLREEYLQLAAIGTIGDIVPLLDENRVIVCSGLSSMADTENLGLKVLLELCGVQPRERDADGIAYIVVPRINAAGRMDSPYKALELFTASDRESCMRTAQYLIKLNTLRQRIQQEIFEQAVSMVESNIYIDLRHDKVIVLDRRGWHLGVIGIAASQVAKLYHRPAVLISTSDQQGIGSARSIEGFNILKALKSCEQHLIKLGGHRQAAGFTVSTDRIDNLRTQVNDYARSTYHPDIYRPVLWYDDQLKIKQITKGLVEDIQRLGPFGCGNPRPNILIKDIKLLNPTKVGRDGKHLKAQIADTEDRAIDAIAFNYNSIMDNRELSFDVLGNLDINQWNGTQRIQMNIQAANYNLGKKGVKKLISLYYKNITSDFLRQIIYNCDMQQQKALDIHSHKMEKCSIDEFVLEKLNCRDDVLVIVNTITGFKRLLDFLSEKSIIHQVQINYNTVNPKGHCCNTVLINCNLIDGLFKNYGNIILYDCCYSKNYLSRLRKLAGANSLFMAVSNTIVKEGYKAASFLAITRKNLADIYRLIRGWQQKYSSPITFDKVESVLINRRVCPFKINLSIEILKELGIIDVMQGAGENDIRIRLIDDHPKQLEHSRLYSGLLQIKDAQKSFYKEFLGIDGEYIIHFQ
jgi:single-stranded-DNA-specific exonuclease